MTESSEGANLANTIRGLKKFDGRNPAEFKTWMKKLCVVISVTRRDILPLLKETARPTHTSNIAEYNKANEDLYAMLFLLVELPASLCVQKHENDDEISGDGQAAFKELCNTYDKVTDEVIRATMEELVNTAMEPGQNPDDYFNQKRLLRIRTEKMGEHISDRYFKDICVTGFTDNYKDVKMMMYRDPSFDVDQMQTTMRHMFLDEQSRNGTKGRIAGRGSVMTAVTSEQDIICYWCKNRGHSKKDCPKFKSRTKPAGAAKWCSVHRTTTHRNEEYYSQGATRPTKNASVSLACTNCRHCTSADSKEPTVDNTEPSHSGKPVINFASGSGVVYTATTSASVWHRRLGHMNPRNMEVLRNKQGNGVEYTGTISGCDICSVTKSKQQAHPKKSTRKTTRPMQLVYTDLMGPFTPAAKGGYRFVSKFTDDYSRMKEIFLLKKKTEAAESLHQYNMTVSAP